MVCGADNSASTIDLLSFQYSGVFMKNKVRVSTVPLAVSLVFACAALSGCGGGGGDDGSSATTDSSAFSSDLAGAWKADIGGIISENPLLIAATGNGTCSGPVTLNLNNNGTFTQSLNGRCTFPSGDFATITVVASGNYSASGSQITVTNATNSGSYTAGGISQSFSLISNGIANFTLGGNTLILKPALERGTQQTYLRDR